MFTITIRLPEELMDRVERAAQGAKTTIEAFILDTISERVGTAQEGTRFHAQAAQRADTLGSTGQALAWKEMRGYLEDRAAGMAPARPKARELPAPAPVSFVGRSDTPTGSVTGN